MLRPCTETWCWWGRADGRFLALDVATGKPRWTVDVGATVLNSPAVDARRGRVYFGGEDMRVRAIALADGQLIWTSPLLPGSSFRGYHAVIAPDGSVLITSEPVIGYDQFQNLLLEMVREVFGDFASWRHNKEENVQFRRENFQLMKDPATYRKQVDYLRRRLTHEPAFQTFFVLDPETGQQRFVAPIVSSESMNGPAAPPIVTPDGKVIVKYQVLLRSRYEHYSPFLNVGYLDTQTGDVTPLMDQTRTYGWYDSLLLVHDEQCQLTVAGSLLLNTHQDNVNALDLHTLRGYPQPLALNIHEPAQDEALTLRLEAMRGHELPPGDEWLVRGTAVYGGGSVLDVPVAVAGDSFYYLPTHELNSGCALIAYQAQPDAAAPQKVRVPTTHPTEEEWQRIKELPWDWDALGHPRLKSFLESLPSDVPGTMPDPLIAEAQHSVAAIADADLDRYIWQVAFDPGRVVALGPEQQTLLAGLRSAVEELMGQAWRPLLMPAGKAPQETRRYFSDPSQTLYTLLLARPLLDAPLREQADRYMQRLGDDMPRRVAADQGRSRVAYDTPEQLMNVVPEQVCDDLARLYPLWLWSRTPLGRRFMQTHWKQLRSRLHTPSEGSEDDCGNARVAGLIAYCRMAQSVHDAAALNEALPITRAAIRRRLVYELAHTRGGVTGSLPRGGAAFVRWRHLTPDVAQLLVAFAPEISAKLMASYVDYQRPGWWIAWNVEQLMRNEVPYQSPTTPLEIFTARALLLHENPDTLAGYLDLPWCRADEYYLQKLALTLLAHASGTDGNESSK